MTLGERSACDGVSAEELRLARAVLDGVVAVGPAGAPVHVPDLAVPAGSEADELVATLAAARERLGRLLESVEVLASGLPVQEQAGRRPARAAGAPGHAARRTASARG